MWEINNIVSRLRIVPKPPPKPEPPPETETQPTANADARGQEQNQLGLQWKTRLEKIAPPLINQAGAAFENIFDSNNPSPERIRQIAQENAPLLVLPQSNSGFAQIFEGIGLPNASQGNLPADPNEFIAHSRFREDVPVGVDVKFGFPPISVSGKDNQFGDNTNDDTSDDFTAAEVGAVTDESYFLDLDNNSRETLGDENAPVSYQFQPAQYDANGTLTEPPRLTYHLFYAYNDAPKVNVPVPGLGVVPVDLNHEGDWERVTYELDPKNFQPTNAVLSAHEGGSTIAFDDLQKDEKTNRPLVFVANGSHANYATPGNHPIEVAGVPVTYDQTSDLNDAAIFDTGRNLNDVTEQAWYPSAGSKGLHWGEIGETSHSGGPQGPSFDKGAVEP